MATTLAGIIRVDLPDGSVRLADGGVVYFGGDAYRSEDALFGSLLSASALSEGVGDEIPGGEIVFRPPSTVPASDVNRGDFQGTRVRMWIAEIDGDTGAIVGTPEQEVDGQIDVTTLRHAREGRTLNMVFVSRCERLFIVNEGNGLNGAFHRKVWPGELGLNNAVSVSTTFAWGSIGAGRGAVTIGSGGGGGGGGGSISGGVGYEQQMFAV